MKKKTRSQNIKDWVDDLLSRGKYTFSLSRVRHEFSGRSEVAIRRSLDRLTKKGKIVSIRKGFYIIIPPQYAARGILPPDMYIDQLMKYLNRSYYVGLLNAAAYYGATHQAPQEYYVVTHYPSLRSVKKKGTKINFLFKKELPDKQVMTRKTETGYYKMSSPALTAVDLIRYEKRIGGLNRAAQLINQFTEWLNFDSDDLITKTPTATLQRLGYILDYSVNRTELADSLYQSIKKRSVGLYRVPLKTTESKKGFSSNNRWKVIVNKEISKTE